MKKVLFYAFLLPAFSWVEFSCSDSQDSGEEVEGKGMW